MAPPALLFFLLAVHLLPSSHPHPSPDTWPLSPPSSLHPPRRHRHPRLASVMDFGATGDGETYDTRAIQAAVDAVAAVGGGRVRFPPGDYLTATIHLKSGVVLEVEKGARVLGGTKEGDYPREQPRWYVVVAEDASDVGITGGGEINGQAGAFVQRWDKRKNVMVSWNATGACLGDECRPRLVGFLGCRNVRVWDIRLVDPAYWCLHLVRSDNIRIEDVTILGDFDTPNNDGIDVEDSNNTVITRCHIDTGDDAICPKSSTGPVRNLTATDCWIRTKSSAIKLGSASTFDFTGFRFHNITIFDSHRGLGLQIRDGVDKTPYQCLPAPSERCFTEALEHAFLSPGNVSDITFSNINIRTRYYHPSWWGRAEPIYITTCPRHPTSKVGSISDVRFINISAVSENGVFLSGSEGGLVSNLKFVNVNLTFQRWTNYSDGLFDYRPGCQEMVRHSTAGLMMEYVSGIEMESVRMKWHRNSLKGWNNPIEFRPSTVDKLSFRDWSSDES